LNLLLLWLLLILLIHSEVINILIAPVSHKSEVLFQLVILLYLVLPLLVFVLLGLFFFFRLFLLLRLQFFAVLDQHITQLDHLEELALSEESILLLALLVTLLVLLVTLLVFFIPLEVALDPLDKLYILD